MSSYEVSQSPTWVATAEIPQKGECSPLRTDLSAAASASDIQVDAVRT